MYINRTADILDMNKFNTEAKAANPAIEYVLKFEDTNQLRFTVSDSWGPADDDILDSFMAAYTDQDPDQKIPKIYDIVRGEVRHKHHHDINYKKELTISLIPFRTVSKGEVTKVEWFETLNAQQQPEGLVLKVDISYTRDATGFATFRTTTRTWINRDGSENLDQKLTQKFYFVNPSDMITEGYKRRKLLVQSIQIPTLTFMTEALTPLGYTQESVVLKGREFMDDYEEDFNKFVENSSTITDPADADVGLKTIVVRLRDESKISYNEWLDKAPPSLGGTTTIRQYLMEEFNI